LLATASDPFAGTAAVVAASARVRRGDRSHGALVEVPAVFGGRVVVRGAAYQVERRGADREVWLYPYGGRYTLSVRP
jgi:hypothetical protein